MLQLTETILSTKMEIQKKLKLSSNKITNINTKMT